MRRRREWNAITTVRRDVPVVHGAWKIDSVRNIASNKICAVISRDEPRDVADIIAICRRYSFRWQTVIEEALEKAAFTPEELIYRCRAFPVQLLETVPFTEPRDERRDSADWKTVCDDIRNMTDNRVAPPSAEPLIP
ncbi:MAG: hypothetical protein EA426_14485 [Spirochaetaceae bacterium]|nr:MAG: hypothetical protein EA426_14485 [Spirochaetaceae bacterium]